MIGLKLGNFARKKKHTSNPNHGVGRKANSEAAIEADRSFSRFRLFSYFFKGLFKGASLKVSGGKRWTLIQLVRLVNPCFSVCLNSKEWFLGEVITYITHKYPHI